MKPLIETFQNDFELQRMVEAVERRAPSRVLEIGTWDGGTLWHWLQIADWVTVVDDAMRREDDWFRWADEADKALTTVRGISWDEDVVWLAGTHAPYDFLFIDADHSYDSVRKDWDNYSPMVAEGGLIALHDIFPRPGYGVSRLWEELISTPGCRYMEIRHNEVQPGHEGLCGIGLIYV
jgi:predicted O-methyltransferase YrrM